MHAALFPSPQALWGRFERYAVMTEFELLWIGFELLYSCGHVMSSRDAVNNPKCLNLQRKLSKKFNLISHHKCLPFIGISPCNTQSERLLLKMFFILQAN